MGQCSHIPDITSQHRNLQQLSSHFSTWLYFSFIFLHSSPTIPWTYISDLAISCPNNPASAQWPPFSCLSLASPLSHLNLYQESPLSLWLAWVFHNHLPPSTTPHFSFSYCLASVVYVCVCLAPFPPGFLIAGTVLYFFVPSSAPTASVHFSFMQLLSSFLYKIKVAFLQRHRLLFAIFSSIL